MKLQLMMWVLATGLFSGALAQDAGDDIIEEDVTEFVVPDDRRFRDTRQYTFGAPASTVRAMQLLTTAMQLRAYCADPAIPDAFVRQQLQRFSELTGRQESCQSLLDY